MESGNEYVLQVKGNQKKLLSTIKQIVETRLPEDKDYTLEKNRSRIEERAVYTYSIENSDKIKIEWQGVKNIILVKTSGRRDKKKYEQNRYYITSRPELDAKFYNKKIRAHWKIENSLHWVKDAIMNEDKCMIKGGSLSENVAAIRNVVLNIFRLNGKLSIKYAFDRYTNKLEECYQLMRIRPLLA